jgi:hypothetical protein
VQDFNVPLVLWNFIKMLSEISILVVNKVARFPLNSIKIFDCGESVIKINVAQRESSVSPFPI